MPSSPSRGPSVFGHRRATRGRLRRAAPPSIRKAPTRLIPDVPATIGRVHAEAAGRQKTAVEELAERTSFFEKPTVTFFEKATEKLTECVSLPETDATQDLDRMAFLNAIASTRRSC